MKKTFSFLIIVLVLVVGLAGCDWNSATYLRVSPNDVTVSKLCKITSVNVECDGRSWSAKQYPNWVEVNKRDNEASGL